MLAGALASISLAILFCGLVGVYALFIDAFRKDFLNG